MTHAEQALYAPEGDYPGQSGLLHPPEGVALVYGTESVPCDVVWEGWQDDTRTQVFRIIMPAGRVDRPDNITMKVFPGNTAIVFPALRGMEPPL